MPLKPQRDLAITTARDEARRVERVALAYHWAEVDAHIADALGEPLPSPPPAQEA